MQNELLSQHMTQDFPFAVEYIRLWKRYVNNGQIVYTVATHNNCIQGNFDDFEGALSLYNKIVEIHEKSKQ